MREHEEKFLACCLIQPDILFNTTILEQHFLDAKTRRLWLAMQKCISIGVKIDYISIADADASLDKTYSMTLHDSIPSAANWRFYEGKILSTWKIARLVSLGKRLAEVKDSDEPSEMIELAEKELLELSMSGTTGIKKISEVAPETLKEIQKRFELKGKTPGISTGITGLDAITGGIQDDRYVVIGARPSDGKSALGLNIACHMAFREKKAVGIISAESSNNEILMRVFASEAHIDGNKLNTGMLTPANFQSIMDLSGAIKSCPIYLYDVPNVKFSELKSVARQMRTLYKIDALLVDYVGLVEWEESNLPRHEQVANISKGLKQIGRELKIPVMALAQLKRDAEGREPVMSDLGESGQLEKDADILCFIHHPQKDENDLSPSKLLIKKNRDGSKGSVQVIFKREYIKFFQAERD